MFHVEQFKIARYNIPRGTFLEAKQLDDLKQNVPRGTFISKKRGDSMGKIQCSTWNIFLEIKDWELRNQLFHVEHC